MGQKAMEVSIDVKAIDLLHDGIIMQWYMQWTRERTLGEGQPARIH